MATLEDKPAGGDYAELSLPLSERRRFDYLVKRMFTGLAVDRKDRPVW